MHSLTNRDRILVASSVYTVKGENFRSKEKTKHKNSDLSFKEVSTIEPISLSPNAVLKFVAMYSNL